MVTPQVKGVHDFLVESVNALAISLAVSCFSRAPKTIVYETFSKPPSKHQRSAPFFVSKTRLKIYASLLGKLNEL